MFNNAIMHNTGRETFQRNRVAKLFEPLPKETREEHDKRAERPVPKVQKVWAVGDRFIPKKWSGKKCDCELNAEMKQLVGEVLTVRYLGKEELVCNAGWAWPMQVCKEA